MAVCKSQCISTEGVGHPYSGTFANKFLSHSASWVARSSAMNSASIVNLAIHDYLVDFYNTTAPHMVITYPLVEFTSSLSFTQFASQNPSIIAGNPV